MRLLVLSLALSLATAAVAQTPVDVQPVKELRPTGTLAASIYSPVAQELPFFKELPGEEISTGSFLAPYSIHRKTGKYVSWFGIVRGITVSDQQKGQITLLMDQKYFDRMTDSHIMLVSYSGGGDFRATLQGDPAAFPALSLVRV
jgi:hypothetical protein